MLILLLMFIGMFSLVVALGDEAGTSLDFDYLGQKFDNSTANVNNTICWQGYCVVANFGSEDVITLGEINATTFNGDWNGSVWTRTGTIITSKTAGDSLEVGNIYQAIIGDDSNTKAGYFNDGTHSVTLSDGNQAGFFYEATSEVVLAGSGIAGDFYDGVREVTLANGVSAMHVLGGDALFDKDINLTGTLFSGGVGGYYIPLSSTFYDENSVMSADLSATGRAFYNTAGDEMISILSVEDIFMSAHVSPTSDETYDLGDAPAGSWRTLYIHNITATGNITTTANITGDYFYGDGSLLTGISDFWNRVGTTLSPKTAGDDITTTGTVSANRVNVVKSTSTTSDEGINAVITSSGTGTATSGVTSAIYGNSVSSSSAIHYGGNFKGIDYKANLDVGKSQQIVGGAFYGSDSGRTYGADGSRFLYGGYFGVLDAVGTWTNNPSITTYGAYIKDSPTGYGTNHNHYSLYSVGGDNYLGGDLDIGGNITGNQIYGGMWEHNHTATPVQFVVQDTWYPLWFQNATHLNGFSWVGGWNVSSNLTAQVGGTYQATYMAIGSGENNEIYLTTVLINNVPQDNCGSHKKMSAGGDVLTMTGTCFIDLAVDDDVSLATQNMGGTGDGQYYGGNINLVRIGT